MNPLVPYGRNIYHFAQNFVFKKRRDQEKFSYEHCFYDSVDDESLSYILCLKI